MSYAYTQRKKTIRRFKEKYLGSWRQLYRSFVKEIRDKQSYSPIGKFQKILDDQVKAIQIITGGTIVEYGQAKIIPLQEIMDARMDAMRLQEGEESNE